MLKGWRTRLYAAMVFMLGLFETTNNLYTPGMLPDKYEGWVLMAVGVGIFLLRQITTTPPGSVK